MSHMFSRTLHMAWGSQHLKDLSESSFEVDDALGSCLCESLPLELQGMYLEAKRRTDLRDVQTSNLLYYGGFASVIETPCKDAVIPLEHYRMVPSLTASRCRCKILAVKM